MKKRNMVDAIKKISGTKIESSSIDRSIVDNRKEGIPGIEYQ